MPGIPSTEARSLWWHHKHKHTSISISPSLSQLMCYIQWIINPNRQHYDGVMILMIMSVMLWLSVSRHTCVTLSRDFVTRLSSNRIITRTLLISGPDTLTEKNSKWSPSLSSLVTSQYMFTILVYSVLTVLSMAGCPVMVLLYTACPGPWLMCPGTWLTPIIVIPGLRSASIITITLSLSLICVHWYVHKVSELSLKQNVFYISFK